MNISLHSALGKPGALFLLGQQSMAIFRKLFLALLLAGSISASASAQSSFTAKDASLATQTFASFACRTSMICSMAVPADQTGAAFGVSGNPFFAKFDPSATLPAFASTPTFNCGTGCYQATQPISASSLPLPAGAATQTTLASILSALGSPFQAGASIGNTAFGANQGTAGSNVNAWWARIGDGTNGPVAVKPASTAPSASDPALVAAISPNGNQIKSGSYVSAGTQQNALAVSTNTTLTVPSGTTCAEITVEGAGVRRTSDGTSATASNGTLIQAGSQWQDCGPLAAYKFTAVSGSPSLDVEYFKLIFFLVAGSFCWRRFYLL
jgi:hypothetical protein